MEIALIENSRIKLFWVFNILGWSLRSFIVFLIKVHDGYTFSQHGTYYIFITFLYILFSYFLRNRYKRFLKSDCALTKSAIIILSYSLCATLVVYLISYLPVSLILNFNPVNGWKLELIPTFFDMLINFLNSYFSFVLWSSFYFTISILFKWKIEIKEKEKALQLADTARLEMLNNQLQPHFLFNSLNSVYSLIVEDSEKAQYMVSQISEFLRSQLLNKNKTAVRISDELKTIQHFISIQKIRFEKKLIVNYQIDSAANDFYILSFVLQPLIENSIKYGKMTKESPLNIQIISKMQNGNLLLKIRNTGGWIEKDTSKNGTNTGLYNIKQRLNSVYKDDVSFKIIHSKDYVEIEIKFYRNLKSSEILVGV